MDKGPYKNVAPGKKRLRLREMRLQAGLTQEQVAQYIGKEPNAISRYENGAREVGAEILIKLAELYDCPVGALFEGGDGLTDQERAIVAYTRAHPRERRAILSMIDSFRESDSPVYEAE